MARPQKLGKRQEDLGPAGWFQPEALNPPANQILVRYGYTMSGGYAMSPSNPSAGPVPPAGTPQDQLTAGFAVVTPGNQRYDLVFVDPAGTVQILQGAPVAIGTPAYQGAPGYTGPGVQGPQLPDAASPVAWVLVTQTASVTIAQAQITQINGFIRVTRDLDGYQIDKGFTGGAPAGASINVSALFNPSNESALGSALRQGVITTPPLNLVHLQNQALDDMVINFAPGSAVYGRLTNVGADPITGLGGVWTLSFFYLDATGAEVALTNIATQVTPAPTNLRLASVPKVYARGDVNRPLFVVGQQRLSDLVAGDIPIATNTVLGKVTIANDQQVAAAPMVPAANDSRLGRAQIQVNGADPTGGRFFRKIINLIPAGSITISAVDNPGQDRVDITLDPPPGVPLGGVVEWAPLPVATAPAVPTLPANFEYADGTAVSTVGSPYHPANLPGFLKPGRMKTPTGGTQRFSRGADFSVGTHGGASGFATGGADTIPNDSPSTNNAGGATPFNASGNTNNENSSHSHSWSNNYNFNVGGGDGNHGHSPQGGGNQFFAFISAGFNINGDGGHGHGVNVSLSSGTNNESSNHSHGFGFGGNIDTTHAHSTVAHAHGGENRPVFQAHAYIMRVV